MSLTPKKCQDYLMENNLAQLFQSLMTGLVHDRPRDPLGYIQSCMTVAKRLGGVQNILWDSFIGPEVHVECIASAASSLKIDSGMLSFQPSEVVLDNMSIRRESSPMSFQEESSNHSLPPTEASSDKVCERRPSSPSKSLQIITSLGSTPQGTQKSSIQDMLPSVGDTPVSSVEAMPTTPGCTPKLSAEALPAVPRGTPLSSAETLAIAQDGTPRASAEAMATETGNSPRNSLAALSMSGKKIVFVIGGPGSGKGTQCDRIVKNFGFTHLSSGDLLRAEVASGSGMGEELKATMEKGELVPLDVVLKLIMTAMEAHQHSRGFLIDGYPRELQQGIEFEKTIGACSFVLWLDVSQDTMVQRLLKRGQTSGRVDDNEETIRKRLKTFVDETEPVIKHYQEQNKVVQINSERGVDEIFTDIEKVFSSL